MPILLDRRIDLSNKDKENGLDQEEDLLDEQLDESHEKPVEEEAELSLEQQVDDLKDQLLRAQAEVQNVRRVAGQEITKARLYGVEFLAREFLVVGDNLQKALESCNEKAEIDSIKEGLELTLRSFEDSLETAGIVPLSPDGESFDPERHEAISVVEDDKKEPNTVIDVIQRGFTIQNRILRPAKVVVTKKPDKK
ncbi:MAG TPA: nucleotide exchange factor GrpE [Gammaproteobacteria bacterium]|nr:nucleotide exchange factor GrpE [Gammaproteobacteria bacterium]HIA96041.1 nucleotide exchange factor GrpE [Gammaproteobacteria bacterium]HIB74815.1 nucleotide exchange factor GrpE [Gammaproteobacteria bacterium]HIN74057.1 nucleotide exchange factor GrpE [Gammaproteobacteria bacterium]